MNDNMDNDLNGHAQRAAFTYASKAIVDESWTQMDAFPEEDDDVASDYETEEEVCYVTLDFGNEIPQDALVQADAFQLTSLNSSEPFARIGPHIMRGRHERLLGSELLFQHESADPEAGRAPSLTHVGTTPHRISFEKLTLTAKPTPSTSLRATGTSKNEPNASNFLLTTGRQNPARVLAAGRGGRGSGRGRGKATSAGAGGDDDDDGSTPAPSASRARGRGGRGRGIRAPPVAAKTDADGNPVSTRGSGRPRGRPRKRGGRGRGRGGAAGGAGESEGSQAPEEGQSQLFAGDTGDPAGSHNEQSIRATSAQDLPDVEEF